MPDQPFALFVEDEKGPMFREFCSDMGEARRKAQDMADREGFPVLIFSFIETRQVGRFKPKRKAGSGVGTFHSADFSK